MHSSLFRPTLLVMATIASSSIVAAPLALNGNPASYFSVVGQDLLITGEARGTASDPSVVRVSMSAWNDASIVNQARLSGEADYGNTLLIEPALFASNFTALSNEGAISSKGMGSSALTLGNHNEQDISYSFVGVSGLTSNSGSLESSGADSAALRMNVFVSESGLLNTGSIQANGDQASAIDCRWLCAIVGTLENRGSISATGTSSTALDLTNLYLEGTLENHGTIEALGQGSRAIVLDNLSSASNIVSQGGRITADGIAIDIAAASALSQDMDERVGIELNDSLLRGGEAAIRAHGNAVLVSRNSTISGDLLGLQHITLQNSRFNGSSIQGNGTLSLQDSVEFQQAHTRLDSNLTVMPGSTLVLNLGQQTNPDNAILQATGAVELNNSRDITFALTAPEDFNPGQLRTYTLLAAPQLDYASGQAENIRVTSLSNPLKIFSYQLSDQAITATLGASSAAAVAYLRKLGAPEVALPAYSAFYDSVLEQLDAQDPLRTRFTNSTGLTLLELVSQLPPDASSATPRTHVDNHKLLAAHLQLRGNQLRQGLSSGDGQSETGAWAALLNNDADQDSRGSVSGYTSGSQGILLGADGRLNAQTTLGLAYSYLDSDINASSSQTASDAHSLSLYGSWEQQACFVDGNLSLGLADNDLTRRIADTRVEGDYDSQLYAASLIGGYRYSLHPRLELNPLLGTRYTRIDSDHYREQGSLAALSVDEQRYEAGEWGAGLRLAGLTPLGEGHLRPQITVMAWQDLIADQGAQSSRFLVGGNTFITTGQEATRNSYEARLGIDYERGAVTFGLNYDYLGRADFSSDSLSAKWRYAF